VHARVAHRRQLDVIVALLVDGVELIQSFIDQGDVAGLDTACLAQLGPTTFDLTLPTN
jgi:hypothetical protein